MSSDNITKLQELIQYAHKSGATSVEIISTKDIVIDNKFADMCLEPRCGNYGLSKSCPPHVSGPSAFKKKLEKFNKAIFFKIDVPSEILYSNERLELFQLLHETAANIEQYAIKMGYINAQAYAGGSCKELFCHDHSECQALSKNGKCRNPLSARPSMSGFGINVAKLMEIADWTANWVTHDTDSSAIKMANVNGLILLY